MKKLNRKIAFWMIFGILLSIGFIGGILIVIFFASKSLLGIFAGVLLIIAGFYGAPCVFTYAGLLITKRNMLKFIEESQILDFKEMEQQLGVNSNDIINRTRWLMKKGYLKGYKIVGNHLEKIETNILKSGTCKNCGAKVIIDQKTGICPYCSGPVVRND